MTEPAPDTGHRARHRRPADGGWLALVVGVVALAAVLYGWGAGHAELQPYYTAAVRSMAASWHAFVYGGFDPSGALTVDKVPGGLWPQALSLRLFGPHRWAVALPQVIEGTLAVYALYRVVAAWVGAWAGLLAALLLALTPVTVALNRHNIPDTLFNLLLVLVAGAVLRAVRTGRLVPLVAAGVLVGCAFQVKMVEAWLVWPAAAAAYLVAAPPPWRGRLWRLGLASLAGLVVSGLWLALVGFTPAADRPYLDGTTDNNPLSLALGYNGAGRFGVPGIGSVAQPVTSHAHPDLLVTTVYGSQVSWLLPVALLASGAGLVWLRGRPRTDGVRAGVLLFTGWLVLYGAAFCASHFVHAYYLATLAPPIAALAGYGLVRFWRALADGEARPPASARGWALPVTVAVTVSWVVVLASGYRWFAPGLTALVLLLGLGAAAVLAAVVRSPLPWPRVSRAGMAVALVAMLATPAVWAGSALDRHYSGPAAQPAAGPVGTDFRASHPAPTVLLGDPDTRTAALLSYLRAHRHGERYLVATERARLAEPLLRAAPVDVLAIGGFTGRTPYPTRGQLAALVAAGALRYVLLAAGTAGGPAPVAWTRGHCRRVPRPAYDGPTTTALYDCQPA
jgi:4-amino-4-deoxy-L-arabinose transferase-like glycosyltransferase